MQPIQSARCTALPRCTPCGQKIRTAEERAAREVSQAYRGAELLTTDSKCFARLSRSLDHRDKGTVRIELNGGGLAVTPPLDGNSAGLWSCACAPVPAAAHGGAECCQLFDRKSHTRDWRIASRGMLLENFSPMTGAASPNRVGVVDGEKDQHGRAARSGVGGDGSLPVGQAG
jgi:hypothetical protein